MPGLVWFGPTADRSVYITIDDGWVPSARVLQYMEHTHLPVTAFLIQDAAEEHLSYWRSFVSAGGTIEDHTVSHPALAAISPDEMYTQWHAPLLAYNSWFHGTPTLGRPPYGSVNTNVYNEALRAGLKKVIMWSAVVSPKGIQTWNHKPLAPGDIVLLHWAPGLYGELMHLLTVIQHDHLTVRSLPAALGQGS